jgi:RimJ/RimL family protein N-acetyltransferase
LIELDTARLRLRQWCDEDLGPFARLNADPEVMAFFPSRLERAASDAMASRIRGAIAERGWGFWAVEERASGVFIGFIGLQPPAARLPFSPCIEIGWRLARAYWGKGYATEGARASLRAGFEQLGLGEIVSFTALGNRRSRAVMERLGMLEDAQAAFDHPSVPEASPLRAHCLYRLSRERWARL